VADQSAPAASLSGVLVVDKPAGPTSFDVVSRVRRALRARKAGHAGTLDPAATGVLVVCLEEAVRLQQFLTEGEKAYLATVAFGAATDTQDAEGRVVAEGDPAGLSGDAVRAALRAFLGELDQVPPMYSAVRVGGRRLHEAARAGEEVPRQARRIRVHALELLELLPAEGGRRLARLSVRCGKGTYVRTLAADLGGALGVPAHLAALRRTASCGFGIEQAVPLQELEAAAREGGPEALRSRLVPLARALGPTPRVEVSVAQAVDLVHGRWIPAGAELPLGALVGAVDGRERLVAVCRVGEGRLQPERVFLAPAAVAGGAGPQDH
jgi:tRNA pseudouridine55 synthase